MALASRARVRCRSCGRLWGRGRTSCPRCLAALPAGDDVVRTCRFCGREWPPPMDMCPVCLAELDPDPAAALESAMREGTTAYRPAGVPPFSSGDALTVRRLRPDGALVYLAADVLIEANVAAHGDGYICVDIEGPLLFGLRRHGAVWLATDRNDHPLAAFEVRSDLGGRIDVRDNASAPCARLERRSPSGYDLIETGGGRLGTCDCEDRTFDDAWVDDAWTLAVVADDLPLGRLALAVVPLAAKLLLGRPQPISVKPEA